jgi:chlorite dismutase
VTEKPKARELNKVIRYTMWSVFKVETPLGDANRDELTAELSDLVGKLAADDVVIRGIYDVEGFRAGPYTRAS